MNQLDSDSDDSDEENWTDVEDEEEETKESILLDLKTRPKDEDCKAGKSVHVITTITNGSIWVRVNDICSKALVDTGATLSFVAPNLAE